MANDRGEIEELYIALRGDIAPLLDDAKRGVNETKQELGKLDQAGKKTETTFSKLGKTGKAAMAALKIAIVGVAAVLTGLGAGIVTALQAAEQGLNTVRIRRSFRNLAAGIGQDSNEILAAMQKASAGSVSEMQLMSAAAEALNFKIARTPEEFARLTDSALKLSRIKGVPAAEALGRLIGGLGRREVELLDELGLNLVMINAEIEKISQSRLGKAADELSAVERESIFAEAALNAAAISAQRLGGGIEDIGSSLDKTSATIQDFKNDTNEAFTLLVGRSLEIAQQMGKDLFGSAGIFQTGGNVVAQVFAATLATFLSVAGTIAEKVNEARRVFQGEMGIGEFIAGLTPGGIAKDVSKNFDAAFSKLKTDFAEILAPETVAPTVTTPPPFLPPPEEIEEGVDQVKELLLAAGADLAELQERIETELESSASEHNDKLLEIENEYVQARLALGSKLADDLEALDSEVAGRRAEIFADTRSELTEVEADTNQALQDERSEFEEQERRQTEDHLRAMRQLRDRYLQDLQSAVEQRDARAIVDLRRQFQQESAQQEETFDVRQDRERQDQDRRLQEIREDERRRTDEIMQAQQDRLAELRVYESERDAEIRAGFQQELTALDDKHNQELAKERDAWQAKQEELNSALDNRLAELAQQYAAELELTEEQAQEVLSRLNEFYGEEGSITNLYREFAQRRAALLALTGEEEEPELPSTTSTGPGGRTQHSSGRSFAGGGSMIATSPTLVTFGEAGPELAQFTPLNNIDRLERSTSLDLKADISLHGVPPTMDQGSLEEGVSKILVSALRQAGMR